MKLLLRSFTSSILYLALYIALVASQGHVSHAKTLKILAYGDSLTAGYRLPTKDSYPAQLEALLKAEGIEAEITNAGVSGDTSQGALRRLDWSLKQGPYDWVLLCIGANDGLRLLPVAQLEKNLNSIIEKIKETKAKVLLIGMKMTTNLSPGYLRSFNSVYPKLAKKHELAFYPFMLQGVALKPALNLPDGIHPNKEGYAIIARNVFDVLSKEIKKGQ